MLKIRLQRVGRKHEPSFRLVLTDSKNSTKSGRFKEVLGSYDPRKTTETLNTERIKYWISQGAGLTGTVHNLLVSKKVIDEPKRNVLPRKSPPKKEEVVEEVKSEVGETPVSEAVESPVEPEEEAPTETKSEGAIMEPARTTEVVRADEEVSEKTV